MDYRNSPLNTDGFACTADCPLQLTEPSLLLIFGLHQRSNRDIVVSSRRLNGSKLRSAIIQYAVTFYTIRDCETFHTCHITGYFQYTHSLFLRGPHCSLSFWRAVRILYIAKIVFWTTNPPYVRLCNCNISLNVI